MKYDFYKKHKKNNEITTNIVIVAFLFLYDVSRYCKQCNKNVQLIFIKIVKTLHTF